MDKLGLAKSDEVQNKGIIDLTRKNTPASAILGTILLVTIFSQLVGCRVFASYTEFSYFDQNET